MAIKNDSAGVKNNADKLFIDDSKHHQQHVIDNNLIFENKVTNSQINGFNYCSKSSIFSLMRMPSSTAKIRHLDYDNLAVQLPRQKHKTINNRRQTNRRQSSINLNANSQFLLIMILVIILLIFPMLVISAPMFGQPPEDIGLLIFFCFLFEYF